MAFLDPVNTIARKTITPGVVDLVFKSGPTLAFIKRNCLAKYSGGPSWQENFLYGMLNVDAYTPGDSFDISQQQIFTGGTVTPRYYNVPVTALLEKIKIEMNGPEAVFNYVDMLMQAAALTMSGRLAIDIFKHGQTGAVSGNRTKYINGLVEALSNGSDNGPNAETFASYLTLTRNQAAQFGSALNSPITAAEGTVAGDVSGPISYPILEQAFNSVVYGTEQPDLLITTNKGMSYIKMAFEAQKRYEGTTADFGFTGVKFNGSTIFQDRYAPGSADPGATSQEAVKLGYDAASGSVTSGGETLWFLNTKYIRFYLSTDDYYGFGFSGFIPAQDNSTVVGHYKFAGNMTVQAPRLMRVLWDING